MVRPRFPGVSRQLRPPPADPNDADFAHLEDLNPGNNRRHMGVRETTAAGVRVPGTMGTDADELLALT